MLMNQFLADVVFLHLHQGLLAPSQRQTNSLQLVLLGGRGFGDSLICEMGFPEGPIAKGAGMVLRYLFMFSQPDHSALEQSWLHDSQWCVESLVCSCGWKNRISLKGFFPWSS